MKESKLIEMQKRIEQVGEVLSEILQKLQQVDIMAKGTLTAFQLNNKLKGVGQQMKWSVRDESLHSKMGCQLFNHMCQEIPTLRDECKEDILKAAKLMIELEENYIDKMFEMGDLDNLKAYDLKHIIYIVLLKLYH